MKKTQRTTLLRGSIAGTLATLCIGVIASHMYFVYMSGQYVNIAKQTEEEIYFVRNEIVQIASADAEEVTMHSVVASHLVVIESIAVSFGYSHE